MLTDSLILEIANANSSQGEDVWMLSESQLSDFASALIAANNAKELEGMKAWQTIPTSRYGSFNIYHQDQVAPLIQRVKELEAQLISIKIDHTSSDMRAVIEQCANAALSCHENGQPYEHGAAVNNCASKIRKLLEQVK